MFLTGLYIKILICFTIQEEILRFATRHKERLTAHSNQLAKNLLAINIASRLCNTDEI